ncbi:MAG: type II secretion system F family protein [Candidatus Woesearchaeota archaeon]
MSNEVKPKGKRSIKSFKEEMIEGQDSSFAFKDFKSINELKDRCNAFFKIHFDQKTFEKESKKVTLNKSISRFDRTSVRPKRPLIGLLTEFVNKLGLEISGREINNRILTAVAIFSGLLSFILISLVIYNQRSLDILIIFLLAIWLLFSSVMYFIILFFVMLYFDVRMYNSVRQIEESLPDYLQLASANISAGMTIDRSLWYAVRPKFGILAVEMESVAKSTLAGDDLEDALIVLANKYESRMLRETINLIVEGIKSGGEMAVLLNKLSNNIKETQLMRKEISASVTTYAIFIGVASIIAAPILFALSTQLLTIIQQIFSSIQLDGSSMGSFSFNFSDDSIKLSDFKRFAMLVLVISSFFSTAMISVIRKGSVKDGIRMIPVFIIISLIIYYAASSAFASLMGGMFTN